MSQISRKDFEKIEIRVGTVVKSEPFEKAIKPAYKIWIDFGPLGILKTSAQLTELYQVDELPGRQVAAVVNFPPKQIADFMSQCLILGAVDPEIGTSLLSTSISVKNGVRVL